MSDHVSPRSSNGHYGEQASLAACLPLKITGRHYGQNLARLDVLLSSLMHYAPDGVFDEIILVTPTAEYSLIEEYATNWPELPLRVIDESQSFEAFSRYTRPWQIRPWQRQQIIKLNAPALTEADFVLTLDPDVLALRHFDRSSLLPGGRGLLQPQARTVHETWWRDSARLLGVPPNLTDRGMGVTPALLSREILRAVHEMISLRNRGRPWVDVLLTSYCDWTEYTLYLLTAESLGLTNTHHVWRDADNGLGYPSLQVAPDISLWNTCRAPDDVAKGLKTMFETTHDGIFGIVASGSAAPAESVCEAAARRFPVRQSSPLKAPAPRPPSKYRERATTVSRIVASKVYRFRTSLLSRRPEWTYQMHQSK